MVNFFRNCLVSRDSNNLRNDSVQKTDACRQITWRILIILQPDFKQSHDYKYFDETIVTSLWNTGQLILLHRHDKSKYLERVFLNNYNAYADLLDETDIYRPTEVDAIEPYTCYYSDYTLHKGTAETISRILQLYNIRAAHKPTTTLRHLLANVKDRDESNNREGAVYKIKCSDCHASHWSAGWNLNTRLTEHKRATRNGDANNHSTVCHQLTNHNIDLGLCSILYSTNYF